MNKQQRFIFQTISKVLTILFLVSLCEYGKLLSSSLTFEIFFYHPVLSDNCKNVFPPLLILCSVSVIPRVVLEE